MSRKKGFTLIELLIVISVISILIGIALPRLKGMQDEGNIAKAKAELRTLQTAVESFYLHNTNAYPANLTTLTDEVPLIVGTIPDDPFATTGTSYVYARGGTNNRLYTIHSIGPGGNGSASISNDAVTETNGTSCIYVSNAGTDTQP